MNNTYIFTQEFRGIPIGEHIISKCDQFMFFVETLNDGVLILSKEDLTFALDCGIIKKMEMIDSTAMR